ncbi:MAG: TolC family protein [candidate division WOR-3 bacterium]
MKKFVIIFVIILTTFLYVFAQTSLEDALLKAKTLSIDFKLKVIERDINNKALLNSLPSILPYIVYTVSIDSSTYSNWNYSQSISLSQTIFNLPVFLSILKNKEYSDIANLLYLKGLNDMIQQIIESYFNLLSYQIKLETDSTIISFEETNLKKNKILYENGLISESNFLQIESNYYSLLFSYEKDKITYQTYLEEFINLTGIKSPGQLIDIDTFPEITFSGIDGSKILKNLPEYLIAKKNYTVSEEEKLISYAEFFPKASLNVSYGLTDTIYRFNLNNLLDSSTVRFGISVSFPVFTGFSRSLNVIQKNYSHKSAYLNFLKTEESLKLEINNFDNRIKLSKNFLESSKKLYESAQKNFEKAKILLQNGELNITDYTTIEKTYIESLINHLNSKKEYYKTYYRYLYLIRRIR